MADKVQPATDTYETRLASAFKSHVAGQMRKEDTSIPSDASDDEVLGADYALTRQDVPDMTDDEYNKVLEDQFRPSFTAPKKTFGEAVGPAVEMARDLPMNLVKGIAESFRSPITAAKEAGEARHLQQTMEKMPEPNIEDLRNKGYSEEQIHNVVTGYTETQKSLAGDIEEAAGEGMRATAEAAATYGTLPMGGNIAKGAVQAGAKALLGKEAGTVAAAQVAKRIGSGLAGTAAKHAVEGAALGGAYGVVKGGVNAGAQAAAEGQGAGQIFGAMTHGATHEGLVNAGAGAVIGGVLGPLVKMGAEATVGRKAAQEAAQQQATRAAAATAFKDQFHPSFVGDRFTTDVAQAAQEGVNDTVLAQRIVAKLTNTTPEAADQALVEVMVGKITQYRSSIVAAEGMGASLYPEVSMPASARVGEPLPLSPDLEPVGGAAPPERELPGLAPMRPESPGVGIPVSPPEGFEQSPGIPGATAPGLQLQGVAPAERTPALGVTEPSLGQPGALAGQGQFSESAPTQPVRPAEPNMRMTPAPGPASSQMAQPMTESRSLPPLERGMTEVQPSAATVMGQAEKAPVQTRTPAKVTEPTRNPAEAAFNMNGLGKPTGTPGWQAIGDVAYRTSAMEDGHAVELNYIENLGAEKGAGAAVLKKLTKVADDHQVPMELTAIPLPRGNGKGRIPMEKLVEFYKKHGFAITEEGHEWAHMRREPVSTKKLSPEVATSLKEQGDKTAVSERIEGLTDDRAKVAAGNVTEGTVLIKGITPEGRPKLTFSRRLEAGLTKMAKEADGRLKQRLTGPQSLGAGAGAVDPAAMKDLSISAAAKMFVLGIRSTRKVGSALVSAHGEWIKPHLDKIVESGRRLLMRLIASDRPTIQQLNEIRRMFRVGEVGLEWYDKTWGWLQQHFGEDAEMMARFISATSFGNSTEGNATQALKAFAQWKLGLPFDGHLSKTQATALGRAVRGEVFGDAKAQGFLGALTGDPNAVALDRHVMRVLGFHNAGKASGRSALSNSTYRLYSNIIRDLAKEAGVSPRQYQASLWAAPKIEGIQAEHAAGVNAHRTGSFRPMEQLLEPRMEGLSPAQWVEQNKITYQNLASASEGVLRARQEGGHSFNVADFSPFQRPGFIVTLDNRVAPIGEVSGTQVVRFARRYRDLTDKYHGMLVGLYQNEGTPGMMSMDFNVHLPDNPANEEFAKKLGLAGRQFAVGHIDENGSYRNIATGYDPKVHGEQFEQRPVAEIERQIEGLGIPTKEDPAQLNLFLPAIQQENGRIAFDPGVHSLAVEQPAFALSHYANAAGITEDELKQLIISDKFKPMTDAGVAGAVFVGKDGIIHQYVDPVAPSFNTTKVFGSLRGKNLVQMLDKLKGLEILRGHDVVESYRSQAGFARLSAPPLPPDAELNKVFAKMTEIQGSVVSLATVMKGSRQTAGGVNSFWLFPNGRIVRSTMTHAGHARAMRIPGIRGYQGTDGSAGASVQRLLNMGIVRVQASGDMAGFDLSVPLTDVQKMMLQKIARDREYAAQVTDQKGKLVTYRSSADGELRHVFSELTK